MNNELMKIGNNNRNQAIAFLPETKEDKIKVYNALEACDKLLNDCVGEKIKIKNIYIEENYVEPIVDDETGEVISEKTSKFRTIIFGEGTTYATTSYGVYNSINRLVSLFGLDAIKNGELEVEVVKREIDKEKKMLALKLV